MPKMIKKGDLPTKTCAACGLPFAWRKKWARDWDQVNLLGSVPRGEGLRSAHLILRNRSASPHFIQLAILRFVGAGGRFPRKREQQRNQQKTLLIAAPN